MIVVRSVTELREHVRGWKRAGEGVGFVPTMGFLHEGHLSLVDLVRTAGCSRVVVSIFVNPAQFAPGEDFERYPRNEAGDAAQLESRGVDLLFCPGTGDIYPDGYATTVHVDGPAKTLEGERRPGHFDGVATVVLKLFNLVQPDVAAFGRKDAQQCAVIERMVTDLNVPVALLFGETVRESDGLAMSSRNSYLRDSERQPALALSKALTAGAHEARAGDASAASVERTMQDELAKYDGAQLDYLRVVDPRTFDPPAQDAAEWLLAGAIKVGNTRLIDNVCIRRQGTSAGGRTS